MTLLCQEEKIPEKFKSEVKIVPLKGGESKLSRLRLIASIVKILIKERGAVIIFHDFELLYAILMLRMFNNGNTYIFDMHEDYPSQILLTKKINAYLKPIIYVFLMISEILMLPMFDWLFTADDFLKNKYKNLMKNRITTLFNFPNFRQVSRNSQSSKNLSLAYAGGLYFERGLKELVSLASKLRENEMHLFGRTFTKEEDLFLKKALEDNSNIRYHGYTSYSDLLEILPSIDIGLVLMNANKKFRRNISVKQFDYMLCGMPVIIKSGLVSFVKDNENGFNVSGADEAAERIINMKRDDLKRMSLNNMSRIREKYNWNNESLKMIDGIKKAISLKGASESQEPHQALQGKLQ